MNIHSIGLRLFTGPTHWIHPHQKEKSYRKKSGHVDTPDLPVSRRFTRAFYFEKRGSKIDAPLERLDPFSKNRYRWAVKTTETMIPAFYFDSAHLRELADHHASRFQSAKPFPHTYIDNFLPEPIIDLLLSEFPSPDAPIQLYTTHNESRNNKSSSEKENELGPFTRHFIQCLNSADFVRFLEKLSGVDHLIPDPHIFGGGAHQTKQGGYLKIHIDNNWDTKLLLFRRLNIILFLNRDWAPEYGGNLEFWNKDMTKCEARIEPLSNRLAIFYNSDVSFHGHPEPLMCPPNITRKSIALYYYTAERPATEISALPHTTIYKSRPGEIFHKRKVGSRVMGRFVPPVFMDLYNYFHRRSRIFSKSNGVLSK